MTILTLLRIFEVVDGRRNEHGTDSVAFRRLKEFKSTFISIRFKKGNQTVAYSGYALNRLQEKHCFQSCRLEKLTGRIG